MAVRFAGAMLLLAALGGGALALARRDSSTPIPAVQGASHVSPLLGHQITTEAVVTALREDGFYLQDPAGDGDAATSDGIFVRADTAGLARGDRVRLSGIVEERAAAGSAAGLLVTRLAAVGSRRRISRSQRIPTPVVLGVGGRSIPGELITADELPVDREIRRRRAGIALPRRVTRSTSSRAWRACS